VRGRGIMEKCTFCVQRINRVKRDAVRSGRTVRDGELQPACAQACPTDALVFGNWQDPASRINALAAQARAYRLLEELGTGPAVVYLKAVEPAPLALAEGSSAGAPSPDRREVEGQWLGRA
jgi:Fe-S-cluster-containing dehydrogenase component